MNFEKTELPQYLMLKKGVHLTQRRAGARDAEQLLGFVEQVAGEQVRQLACGRHPLCRRSTNWFER